VNTQDLAKGELLQWCVQIGMNPHRVDDLARLLESRRTVEMRTEQLIYESEYGGQLRADWWHRTKSYPQFGIEIEFDERVFPSAASHLTPEHLDGHIGP
jgi:hypothetical protein